MAVNRHAWFMMDFHSTRVFSVMKVDNRRNFAAGGIVNRRTPKTRPIEKGALGDQLCDGLQGNESRNATSHARAFPSYYIICVK
jgi:hypothetical protein